MMSAKSRIANERASISLIVSMQAAGAALALSPFAIGAPQAVEKLTHETFPERVPLDAQKIARKAPTPLTLNLPEAFQEGRNIHDLGPVPAERIVKADERAANNRPGIPRVGVVRAIEPGALSIEKSFTNMSLRDGLNVWTLAIRSAGAFGLRIHFTTFDLKGASVLVYAPSPDGVIVRGPYTQQGPNRTGDFWTGSLPGDVVYVEITDVGELNFEITEILHFDRDPASPGDGENDSAQFLGGPLPCHLDVMCFGGSVDSSARDATGQMSFISGASSFVCTGTLLKDLDSETFVPYFLTAFHCLATQAEVDTLEVVWFWQKDSCDGTLPSFNSLPVSNGGTVVSTNSDNDMSFLRLPAGLPGGITFAGWTTETSLDNAYGVHHPAGSWKRAVFVDSVGTCPGCTCWSGSTHDYYNMTDGLTEGGSSGSGVFNSSGQLAGQLHGCCGDLADCDNRTCSNIDSYWSVYGEFEETYPLIRYYLEVGGTMHVDHTNTTFPWDGTPTHPFPTVSQANSAAWNGLRIKIRAGSYPETLTMSKQLTLIAGGGTVTIGQ